VHDHGISKNNPLRIETSRGVLTLQLELKAGKVEQVTVDMGEPILEAHQIPATLPGPRVVKAPLARVLGDGPIPWAGACGLVPDVTCVSMGNPHAVIYCADVAKVPLEQVGPLIENAAAFPRRVN